MEDTIGRFGGKRMKDISRCNRRFWEALLRDHQLNYKGVYHGQYCDFHLHRINTYFKQLGDIGMYLPRAIVIHLDTVYTKDTLTQYFHNLVGSNNILGHSSTSSNWAKGYYEVGPKVIDTIMNTVRNEAEACDSLQGIQIMHSLGGGTGGGLGSLLAQQLYSEFSNKVLQYYSVIPSRTTMSVPELYNTILTLQYLNDYIHQIFCMDYDKIENIHKENQGKSSTYDWISSWMSGITTCLRLPCQLNTDLKKMLTNMVPRPELHFLVPGYVETRPKHTPVEIVRMTQGMFDDKNIFLNFTLVEEQIFTAAATFRGKIPPAYYPKYVGKQIMQIHAKYRNSFVESIPPNILTAVCSIMPCCERWSVASLLNTSAINQPFETLVNWFEERFNQNCYLHWYLDEGMDKAEFTDAQNNINNILSVYKE